jgi:hypothetical protein
MSAPPIRSRDDRKRKKTNAPKPISEPFVAKSSSQPSTAGASQASDIRRCGQSCSPYRATLIFRHAPPSSQQSAVRGGVVCMAIIARMWAKTSNTISGTRSSQPRHHQTHHHHHLVPPTLSMPPSTSLSSLLSLDATAATAVGCRRCGGGVRCRG